MASKLNVVFTDGRSEQVALTPRIQVQLERKFGNPIPPVEAGYFGCWIALGRPGKFDDWLETVDDVEPVPSARGEEDPTNPGVSDGS